ncbi:methyltransferase, TIGR04325 family [Maritimibacter alkaliphilus]|uniref:methyltransferase, TIGR04325 family n=1 Tax=Maritimibacter alkaliphilus TaxID=404236 RepID=UPI001C9881C0|nr:methyltransferase, TIGR04325 family [Maritimibacter alkaliphilus]MBY6089580.1 methyltransferase, TIGR04325 family [Maritimibacter alkaliphilus]
MSILGKMKRGAKRATEPMTAALARASVHGPRPPRFAGAFPSIEAALASLPKASLAGYDHDEVAEVSFEAMTRVELWDYPVFHWIGKLLPEGGAVVDFGGHMGTKHIAFGPYLDMARYDWTVCDLPAIIRAARAAQTAGRLPGPIRFEEDLAACPAPDLFLASGVMQYFPGGLGAVLAPLAAPPDRVILNKVALRDGPQVVTLEKIGASRVPYQIRSEAAFVAEIETLGYRIADRWEIEPLAHRIPTHPRLGASRSTGFVLTR